MATVTLTASFPGSHVIKGSSVLMLDNPEAEETVTPTGSFPVTPDLELEPDAVKRLLLVQYDDEIQLVVTKAGESPAGLVPITLRTNGAALASYACMLNGSSVNVYVKEA